MTRYDPKRHHRRSIRLTGYDYGQPGAYFVTICAQGGECLFGQVKDGRMNLSPGGEMVWRWWRGLNEKYPSVRTDAAVVMPNHFHGIIVITGDPQSGQPHGQPPGQPRGQPRRVAPTGGGGDGMVGATPGGRPPGGRPPGGRPLGGRPHANTEADVDGDGVVPGQPPGQPRGVAPTGVGGDAVVGATLGGRPDNDPDTGVGGDAAVPGQPPGQPRGVAPTGVGGDAAVGATPCGRPDDRPPTLGQIVGWFKTMTTNEYIRGVKQLGWPPFPGKVWQRNYYEHIIRNREALERIRGYIQTNPERWALDRENPQRTGLDELESWIYRPRDDQEA